MASNLSCLGFEVADNAALEKLVVELAAKASIGLACEPGDYVIWRSRTGAELWFHLARAGSERADDNERDQEIVGLTPFFEGRSRTRVALTHAFQREGDNAFEGAFQGWLRPRRTNGQDYPDDPDTDWEEHGIYPIVFDCVDFAAHKTAELPTLAEVALVGFAREIETFKDEEAFDAAQTDEDMVFASRAFFPVGMFAAAETEGASGPPSAHAILTGKVLETSELTNESSGGRFRWLLVESYEARFDIVAEIQSLPRDVEPGAIVKVGCWMFGRILPAAAGT